MELKKIAKLFPKEKAYVDTADNVVKVLCDRDMNYFYTMMDSFVKDALARTNLVEFCED